MIKKHILAGLIVLVAGSLFLGGCSAQQTPTAAPTVDANAIYTQAAQTVQAGMAQTEAAQPATPTTPPPTDTPAAAPTNTVDATLASAMTATANSVLPGAATATLNAQTTTTPSALKSATPTLSILRATNTLAAPKATGDKAELVGQVPGDGSRIPSGASFDVALTFKNTGVTTWTPKYTLKFYAGDKMGSPNDFNMTKNVKPGETITLQFSMGGSTSKGKKTTIWVLQNADGVNFYSMFLQTEVVD